MQSQNIQTTDSIGLKSGFEKKDLQYLQLCSISAHILLIKSSVPSLSSHCPNMARFMVLLTISVLAQLCLTKIQTMLNQTQLLTTYT